MYILVPTWGWAPCPTMRDPACVWPVPPREQLYASLNPTKFCLCGRLRPLQVLSRGSFVAQMEKNLPAMQETQVQSLGWEDHLEKWMVTHYQYSCLGNSMLRGVWQATVHGVSSVRHDNTFIFTFQVLSTLIMFNETMCFLQWEHLELTLFCVH